MNGGHSSSHRHKRGESIPNSDQGSRSSIKIMRDLDPRSERSRSLFSIEPVCEGLIRRTGASGHLVSLAPMGPAARAEQITVQQSEPYN